MHCDMLDPELEMNTNTKIAKKAHGKPDEQTDGHSIPPLIGFEPLACGRMRCA